MKISSIFLIFSILGSLCILANSQLINQNGLNDEQNSPLFEESEFEKDIEGNPTNNDFEEDPSLTKLITKYLNNDQLQQVNEPEKLEKVEEQKPEDNENMSNAMELFQKLFKQENPEYYEQQVDEILLNEGIQKTDEIEGPQKQAAKANEEEESLSQVTSNEQPLDNKIQMKQEEQEIVVAESPKPSIIDQKTLQEQFFLQVESDSENKKQANKELEYIKKQINLSDSKLTEIEKKNQNFDDIWKKFEENAKKPVSFEKQKRLADNFFFEYNQEKIQKSQSKEEIKEEQAKLEETKQKQTEEIQEKEEPQEQETKQEDKEEEIQEIKEQMKQEQKEEKEENIQNNNNKKQKQKIVKAQVEFIEPKTESSEIAVENDDQINEKFLKLKEMNTKLLNQRKEEEEKKKQLEEEEQKRKEEEEKQEMEKKKANEEKIASINKIQETIFNPSVNPFLENDDNDHDSHIHLIFKNKKQEPKEQKHQKKKINKPVQNTKQFQNIIKNPINQIKVQKPEKIFINKVQKSQNIHKNEPKQAQIQQNIQEVHSKSNIDQITLQIKQKEQEQQEQRKKDEEFNSLLQVQKQKEIEEQQQKQREELERQKKIEHEKQVKLEKQQKIELQKQLEEQQQREKEIEKQKQEKLQLLEKQRQKEEFERFQQMAQQKMKDELEKEKLKYKTDFENQAQQQEQKLKEKYKKSLLIQKLKQNKKLQKEKEEEQKKYQIILEQEKEKKKQQQQLVHPEKTKNRKRNQQMQLQSQLEIQQNTQNQIKEFLELQKQQMKEEFEQQKQLMLLQFNQERKQLEKQINKLKNTKRTHYESKMNPKIEPIYRNKQINSLPIQHEKKNSQLVFAQQQKKELQQIPKGSSNENWLNFMQKSERLVETDKQQEREQVKDVLSKLMPRKVKKDENQIQDQHINLPKIENFNEEKLFLAQRFKRQEEKKEETKTEKKSAEEKYIEEEEKPADEAEEYEKDDDEEKTNEEEEITNEKKKEKQNEVLKSQVKSELKARLDKAIKENEISCLFDETVGNNQALKNVCMSCKQMKQSEYAYQLTEENWFKLGLAHNHKEAYSKLLDEINQIFSLANSTFYIAFNLNQICLSSQQFKNGQLVSVNELVNKLENNKNADNTTNATSNCNKVFKIKDQVQPIFFQTDYFVRVSSANTNSNKHTKEIGAFGEYILDFEIGNTAQYEINNFTILKGRQASLHSDTDALLITGDLQVNKTLLIPFQYTCNYIATENALGSENSTDTDWDVIEVPQVPIYISFRRFMLQFFGDEVGEKLVKQAIISRGINEFGKLHVGSFLFKVYRKLRSITLMDFNFINIPTFSISPEFSLYNCSSHYIISSGINKKTNKTQYDWKLVISCNTHGINFGQMMIIRSENQEQILLNSTRSNLSLSTVKEQLFSKGFQGHSQVELFPLATFDNLTIQDFQIFVHFEPYLVYVLKGKVIGTGHATHLGAGRIEAIIANVGGEMVSAVHLWWYTTDFRDFLTAFYDESIDRSVSEISRVMNTTTAMIFSSTSDVDLANYRYVQEFNVFREKEIYWKKGIEFIYSFQFKDDCIENQMCRMLKYKLGENSTYTLNSKYATAQDPSIIFAGDILESNLVKPFQFKKSQLELIINKNEPESQCQVQILGEYTLQVDNNKILPFEGKLLFQNMTNANGLIMGNSEDVWNQPLGLERTSLNKLSMLGSFETINYEIDKFELNSLPIFGDNCWEDKGTDQLQFMNDRCFYGNGNIKINNKDYHENYLEASLKNTNMYHFCLNFLNLEPFEIYKKIQKHIMNIQFLEDVEMTYALENQYNIETQTNETTQVLEIPQGVTIKAHANFLGFENQIILININNKAQEMYGIFHLNTVIFAGGNALLYEDSNSDLTNIFFRVEQEIPIEEQIYLNTKVSLFDLSQNTTISIDNRGYYFKMFGNIFLQDHEFEIEMIAPFNPSFQAAVYTVKGKVPNSNITAEKQNQLCDWHLCPKVDVCTDLPEKRCVKYKSKEICIKETEFCLRPEQVCAEEMKVCVAEDDVCVVMGEMSSDGVPTCLRWQRQCIEYVTTCVLMRHVCTSEMVIACEESYVEVSKENCEKFDYTCKTEEITDQICKQQCVDREQEYNHYSQMYYNLIEAKKEFDEKLQGFLVLYDELQRRPDSLLTLLSGKFEHQLDQIIHARDITVMFEIASLQQRINNHEDMPIDNFDILQVQGWEFQSEDELATELFKQLVNRWAMRYHFDPVLIDKDESMLMRELFKHFAKPEEVVLFEIFHRTF